MARAPGALWRPDGSHRSLAALAEQPLLDCAVVSPWRVCPTHEKRNKAALHQQTRGFRQAEDFIQFGKAREDAERYGMPIIVWSYPRGEAIEAIGGKDSLYAIDYAARVACELGADIVKINVPKSNQEKDAKAPKPYNAVSPSRAEATRMVVESAGRALVLFSGGEMEGEGSIVEKARLAMDSGATGLIFGRNVWQRPFDEALRLSQEMHEMLRDYGA